MADIKRAMFSQLNTVPKYGERQKVHKKHICPACEARFLNPNALVLHARETHSLELGEADNGR